MAVMMHKLRTLLLLVGMSLLGLPLTAQSGTPLPEVPEATARFSAEQGCVEPTEEMRKNHMKMMLHKRDQTMHEGIRTPQYSLQECISCHVPASDENGNVVRIDNKDHFCASCHSYAGVSIDCFQCHADRPINKTVLNPNPIVAKPSPHQAKADADTAVTSGLLEVLATEGQLK